MSLVALESLNPHLKLIKSWSTMGGDKYFLTRNNELISKGNNPSLPQYPPKKKKKTTLPFF